MERDLRWLEDAIWYTLPKQESLWRAIASADNRSKALEGLREKYGWSGYRLLKPEDLDAPWTPDLLLAYNRVVSMSGMEEFWTDEEREEAAALRRKLIESGIHGAEDFFEGGT